MSKIFSKAILLLLFFVFIGSFFFFVPFEFSSLSRKEQNINRSEEKSLVKEAKAQFAGKCSSRLCKRARSIANGIWNGFTAGAVSGVPTSLPGFGGNIVSAIPCSCPPGGVAFILAPAPGSASGPYYFHPSTSVLYPFGQLRPGAWVLGNAVPGGICGVFALHWCFPFPTEFTVTTPGVGTSL